MVSIEEEITKSLISFSPSLLASTVLLAIGWVIGTVLGKLTEEILRRSNIDEYIFKTKKPAISLVKTTSVVISWSIYLLFIQAALGILGIKVLVDAIGTAVNFLPRLIGAVYIIIAGYAIGKYIKDKIVSSQIEYGDMLSNLGYYLSIYIGITMALSIIGIDVFILNAILLLFLGSLSISLGIAFGFVLKDVLKEKFKRTLRKSRSK